MPDAQPAYEQPKTRTVRPLAEPGSLPKLLQVSIRPLNPNDIPALKPILEQHVRFLATAKLDEIEVNKIISYMGGAQDEHGRTRQYRVAVNAQTNEVIGSLAMSIPEPKIQDFCKVTEKSARELLNFFVSQEFLGGNGVGRALFNEACKMARSDLASQLVVLCGLRHHKAWSFYDRVCDSTHGIYLDFYGPGWPAKIWEKSLDKPTLY